MSTPDFTSPSDPAEDESAPPLPGPNSTEETEDLAGSDTVEANDELSSEKVERP